MCARLPCSQALLYVLGPGYEELTASALQASAATAAADAQSGDAWGGSATAGDARWFSEDPVTVESPLDRVDPVKARQAAVLAALRVVNKVCGRVCLVAG